MSGQQEKKGKVQVRDDRGNEGWLEDAALEAR